MSGICIYAEQYENRIEESAFELITAARALSAQSGEHIMALVLGQDPGCSVTAAFLPGRTGGSREDGNLRAAG